MDASQQWAKATNAVHFMNAVQDRGGRQDKDTRYNSETRVPQPSRPSPQHYNESQSFGQASSYFHGHPQSPFPPIQSPQQHSSHPSQPYSPPRPSLDWGLSSNQALPHVGQYTQQGSGYINPFPPTTTTLPLSSHQVPTSEPYIEQQTTYTVTPAPQSSAGYYLPHQPTTQGSYNDHEAPVPRSFTAPAHECNQHWNPILDRCEICRPFRRTQRTWPKDYSTHSTYN